MFGLRENTNTLKIEKACIQYLENVSKSLSNFKRKILNAALSCSHLIDDEQ